MAKNSIWTSRLNGPKPVTVYNDRPTAQPAKPALVKPAVAQPAASANPKPADAAPAVVIAAPPPAEETPAPLATLPEASAPAEEKAASAEAPADVVPEDESPDATALIRQYAPEDRVTLRRMLKDDQFGIDWTGEKPIMRQTDTGIAFPLDGDRQKLVEADEQFIIRGLEQIEEANRIRSAAAAEAAKTRLDLDASGAAKAASSVSDMPVKTFTAPPPPRPTAAASTYDSAAKAKGMMLLMGINSAIRFAGDDEKAAELKANLQTKFDELQSRRNDINFGDYVSVLKLIGADANEFDAVTNSMARHLKQGDHAKMLADGISNAAAPVDEKWVSHLALAIGEIAKEKVYAAMGNKLHQVLAKRPRMLAPVSAKPMDESERLSEVELDNVLNDALPGFAQHFLNEAERVRKHDGKHPLIDELVTLHTSALALTGDGAAKLSKLLDMLEISKELFARVLVEDHGANPVVQKTLSGMQPEIYVSKLLAGNRVTMTPEMLDILKATFATILQETVDSSLASKTEQETGAAPAAAHEHEPVSAFPPVVAGAYVPVAAGAGDMRDGDAPRLENAAAETDAAETAPAGAANDPVAQAGYFTDALREVMEHGRAHFEGSPFMRVVEEQARLLQERGTLTPPVFRAMLTALEVNAVDLGNTLAKESGDDARGAKLRGRISPIYQRRANAEMNDELMHEAADALKATLINRMNSYIRPERQKEQEPAPATAPASHLPTITLTLAPGAATVSALAQMDVGHAHSLPVQYDPLIAPSPPLYAGAGVPSESPQEETAELPEGEIEHFKAGRAGSEISIRMIKSGRRNVTTAPPPQEYLEGRGSWTLRVEDLIPATPVDYRLEISRGDDVKTYTRGFKSDDDALSYVAQVYTQVSQDVAKPGAFVGPEASIAKARSSLDSQFELPAR